MKCIELEKITKIEGHARLQLIFNDKNELDRSHMQITQGPIFVEKIVQGKPPEEAPYYLSRTCGICSTSHTTCAIKAVEKALQITVPEELDDLRRVNQMAGMMHSHTAHLYFMSLPDYLGFDGAISMSKQKPEILKQGLDLKKKLSDILTILCGRDIQSIRFVVGGYTKALTSNDIDDLIKRFKEVEKDAQQTLELFQSLTYPEFHNHDEFFGASVEKGYSVLADKVEIGKKQYAPDEVFKNLKITYDFGKRTTLSLVDKPYYIGALARIKVAKEHIPSEINIKLDASNIFHNNLAQAYEILIFSKKCQTLLSNIKNITSNISKSQKQDGEATFAMEAPRGTLYHHYVIENNKVKEAEVITPTAQMILAMEDNLTHKIKQLASEHEIQKQAEMIIRAHDPCMSCSTNFLEISREQA